MDCYRLPLGGRGLDDWNPYQMNQHEENVKRALEKGKCELCDELSSISPCQTCRVSHHYLFTKVGDGRKYTDVAIVPGAVRVSYTVPEDEEDCFVRVWYMRQGTLVGKWKVMMGDLDFDCEKMVDEDTVLLYDDKRSSHPANQACLNLFQLRTWAYPAILVRGTCLLAARDLVTGKYRDLQQCDLDRIQSKNEEEKKMVPLAQEMPLEPVPLSGSGHSFEDKATAYLLAAKEF